MVLKAFVCFLILSTSCCYVSASMIKCENNEMVIPKDQQGECPFEDLGFYNSKLGELSCGRASSRNPVIRLAAVRNTMV